jgi:restriction endonuclease S subunit
MITCSIIKKSQLEGATRLDAEFYQPEYLSFINRLKDCPTLESLASRIICGPFGSAILNSDYKDKGIPLLRVVNLNNDFTNDDNLVFIDQNLSNNLKRYQVFPNDIVVSQRGTIAMFSLVSEDYEKYNISANLISVLKSNNINFLYLVAFLNSKFGNIQLIRKVSGQVQMKITTDDIKEIKVFLPSEEEQSEIAEIVFNSQNKLKKSKTLYQQAEGILLKELGLEGLENKDKLFSIVKLSEVEEAQRFDAEYFQEKYRKLEEKIISKKYKLLEDLVSMKKGIEIGGDSYQEKGRQFIRVSSMSKLGINNNDQKFLGDKLYEKLKADFCPQEGEILLTKDATPGIAYVLKEDIKGIVSSGVLRLKVKDGGVNNEYLSLCLNSVIGQMQAERDAGGSIIKHWKPSEIGKVLIPILPQETQQKIAKLVQESHQARKESKELLEEAKRKVEEMIEN